ncbi:MAG: extracellular solute-binding protein family 3, partial [Rhodoferax sp.]|nr:extracellular solute-binding protein family 3 [Rhodoferax sp.]
RRGDDEWAAIVKWSLYAVQEAEELGITKASAAKMKTDSKDPAVLRFLGVSEDTGKLLGLDREWAFRIVSAVGNYGESFERNMGEKTPLGLPRGVNKPWTQGGLIYAMPIR